MDNQTGNKNQIPCQSWMGPNGWSTTSSQRPLLNPLGSSQHLSYDHLQVSGQSCLSDPNASNNSHHSAMYKVSHISNNPSSTSLFANTAIPSASSLVSFAHQNPHNSSALLTANPQKTLTSSHPQPNQGLLSGSQHLAFLSPHDPYKDPFPPSLTSQGLPGGIQGLSMSLPSCGQRINTSQASLERPNMESVGAAEIYTHSYGPSTSQEQPQWTPSTHCVGAVNKPVPSIAAHSNRQPSQKSMITPPNNKRQRSVILHHRAQLLKQLAEMNKLLDLIPPEDVSERESLNTAVQSQLSADCSSPASFDEHNDQISTEASEKIEEPSEDETDPDYSPSGDGDSSDLQSDSDWCSSEESLHSSSSLSMDDEPQVKKKAKSQCFLSKDKSSKKAPPVKWKTSSEIVVLPASKVKAHRDYNKKNYCLFCSQPQTKLSRHLERVHSDRAEVAVAFQYPVMSRERKKIWRNLMNQGNFIHNKDVLRTGKGLLAVQKRPPKPGTAKDFLHCLHCHGLFLRKALNKHMRKCPEKVKTENESQYGNKRVASRCALEILDLGISDGFKSILCEMIYDDVTQAVIDDEILLQFGEQMFNHYGADVKKHDYIRQNLRQIARLVLEAQKTTPLRNLEDFFYPSSFRHVVSAVKVLAGYDPETKTFRVPTLALKLGYHLQKACSIVESNAVKSGDENLAKSAQNFLSVYQKKWNMLVSSGALKDIKETKMSTDKEVPFAQDVKLLNSHLETVHELAEKTLIDNTTVENYAALAKVLLARAIVFNRRKPGEVATIQLTSFMSRKKSEMLDNMDVAVTDLERRMCGFFTRIDIRGKCGRMVPVLLKPSFVSGLELLVKTRETIGVPSENLYLFGRPSVLTAYKGTDCVQKYVKECGAKNPEAMTTRKIQKHYTTMLQLMNMDDEEANQIFGPNHQVHNLHQNSDMQLYGGESISEGTLLPETGQAVWRHKMLCASSYGHTNLNSQQPQGATTEVQHKGHHKWEEAEVRAVERHMMQFILEHKVPQKNDCVQCLEAEPKALSTRSWKGVKDYVRNRITALKRESGIFQVSPGNGKRARQVEPEQNSAHGAHGEHGEHGAHSAHGAHSGHTELSELGGHSGHFPHF
ncbi:uncharacterized protein LOC131463693 [Solea solea]|uniref:uncharacterized protein LOC131463693 n=1 Tax=Solea solea TaxID=90069 RepID=UPI00272BB1C7|nr:uncharacterized protein LOC131463693 [Solea solea]